MVLKYRKALTYLDECELISSRLEKEQILKSAINTIYENTLKLILKYTYDPYLNYYTHTDSYENTKTDKGYISSFYIEDKTFNQLFGILDKLNKRMITGNAAKNIINNFIDDLPDNYHRQWMSRIINRDLRIGVSIKTINKIFKNLIPTFAIQLCDKYDGTHDVIGWICEPKFNGNRCLIMINENGDIAAFSRNGKEVNNIDHIIEDIHTLRLKNVVFDGELYSSKGGIGKNKEWSKTTSIIHTESLHPDYLSLKYWIFDMIAYDRWKDQSSLLDRKEQMSALDFSHSSNIFLVPYKIMTSNENLIGFTDEYIKEGFEGSVIKNPVSTYDYKRSKNWLKFKKFYDDDFEILDVKIGTGRNSNRLGALVIDVNGVEVNVGSGYSDMQRNTLWKNKKNLIGKTAEIKYAQITKDGSLLFPVFIRIRTDK